MRGIRRLVPHDCEPVKRAAEACFCSLQSHFKGRLWVTESSCSNWLETHEIFTYACRHVFVKGIVIDKDRDLLVFISKKHIVLPKFPTVIHEDIVRAFPSSRRWFFRDHPPSESNRIASEEESSQFFHFIHDACVNELQQLFARGRTQVLLEARKKGRWQKAALP